MYKILFDHGSEGFKFHDNDYAFVDDAVKEAIELNYCVPFIIVKIVSWQAKEI